ncbi:MAG: hypothetical protein IT547_04875 [Hyphomonadaceae bacterium]|nr:hypothetical protein [Hyphomonadaceae bacterium]
MNGLRLLLALAAFAGMIALCVLGWNYGGMGGLIGGGLGFLIRLGGRGLDWGERLGNGYVGALMGMPVGLLIGGLITVGAPYLLTFINNTPQ